MQFSSLLALFLSASVGLAVPTQTLDKRTQCPGTLTTAEKARVINAFQSSGIVPTLIPSINPTLKVSPSYGAKAVDLGTVFATTETINTPTFSFGSEPGFDPASTKYALFLVDPDVPNPDAGPLRMNFLHYFVVNAQPSCIPNQQRQTVTIYEPLTPASTQQHRYTFLVYRQPKDYTISPTAIVEAQLRPGFDLNSFVASQGFTLVGGNYLQEAITNGTPLQGA